VLVESVEDVARLDPPADAQLAWASQTTLSVDDTREIVAALVARFPAIAGPHKDDICYATTNRQMAVKELAARVDALLVVGAPNSSNSQRLVEVAAGAGCARALLIQRAADIDWDALAGIRILGLTAGASAPELLVREVVEAARARFDIAVEEIATTREDVHFNLPRLLAE
jgi:4-hydroxy-3-methylbut-2-enyl diphosphate reductase